MSILDIVLGIATGSAAVAAIAGGAVFLFRNSVDAALKRSLEKQLAEHRAELAAVGEVLRHDLAREMLHAQRRAERIHGAYPRIDYKLRQSLCRLETALERYTPPPIDEYNDAELADSMSENTVHPSDARLILELRNTDPAAARKKLTTCVQWARWHVAYNEIARTRNLIQRYRLHLDAEIADAALYWIVELENILRAARELEAKRELSSEYINASRAMISAMMPRLDDLYRRMRAELSPKKVEALTKAP